MRRIYILIIFIIILAIIFGIGLYDKMKDMTNINIKSNTELDSYITDNNVDTTKTEQTSDINIKFTDNKCLAIGYVLNNNESEFVKKYFNDFSFYKNLKVYDFRSDTESEGNKFVIIPKNDDIKAIVYACEVTEDGDLMIKNNLIDLNSKGPYIIKTDYNEYLPRVCIGLNYKGFEEYIPITFSGENGHLSLVGFESEVIDISLYKEL